MKILVVGASGFLGRNLCAFLVQSGHQVVGVLRSAHPRAPLDYLLAPDLVSLRQLDLRPHRFDAIVNAAGAGVNPLDRYSVGLMDANVLLPVCLMERAAESGISAVVHIGSSAEYAGVLAGVPIPENAELETRKIYGATKAAGSIAALGVAGHLGVPAMVLRSFNLFGAGEAPHRLLPTLVRQLSIQAEVLLSPGTQIRDFVPVNDACAAILRAVNALLKNPNLAGVYNLATGIPTRVADFARAVASALGTNEELLRFGAIAMRADETPWVVGAPDRLRNATGWSPSAGLATTIDDIARLELSSLAQNGVQG